MNQLKEKINGAVVTFGWKNFTAAQIDAVLSAQNVVALKPEGRVTLNRAAAEAGKLYDKCVTAEGLPDGMKLTLRRKYLAILAIIGHGDLTFRNPDAAQCPGETVEVEVSIPPLDEGGKPAPLVLKFGAPTESQQAAYEANLARKVTNQNGETSNAGHVIENYRLARELFRGAEGYAENKVDAIPAIHLTRAVVLLFGEVLTGFDSEN